MAEERREGRGYRVVLTGIRGILRLLVFVCLFVVLFYLGRRSYALGHEAFDEQPVDIGEGRTVVVTITDDMSTYQIGRMLRAEGLLTESAMAFWLQELISEYHNQILPGTYALKTSMTTQDMFPILAQADKISEQENSTFLAPGMQVSGTGEEVTEDLQAAEEAPASGEAETADDTQAAEAEETASGSQEETPAEETAAGEMADGTEPAEEQEAADGQ